MQARVLGRDDGERHDLGAASRVTIKAGGEHTGGTLFMADTVIAPGFGGPPPHTHERLHDMFYVLDGVLTVQLGTENVEAGPGSFVCVPPGVTHTFSNRSERPVQFLNINTPAGWENYMRDLGRELPRDRPPAPEDIGRIASRYDFHPVA
ncbi:MAG: cupin domain-containing protein [Candidatus Dormibacteraeota bacterium]|nr:cupin domain-containing protein [Candidatus Dormibacteraeota bacterium]